VFKSEWRPLNDNRGFSERKQDITRYITGYYRQQRPHQYNDGLTQNESKNGNGKDAKT